MSEENSDNPAPEQAQEQAQAAPDLAASIQALAEMPIYVIVGIDREGQPVVIPQVPSPEDRGVIEMSMISSTLHYIGRSLVNDAFPRAMPTENEGETGAVRQEAPGDGEGDNDG